VLGARVGNAQTATAVAPVYPQADTDRPLVLFPGMTVLDISVNFETFFATNTDSMGNTTTTRFIRPELDLALEHAFGPMEVLAELTGNAYGPLWAFSGQMMLGPGALSFTFDGQARTPNSGISSLYDQIVAYSYKRLLLPHWLAIYAGGNVDLGEVKVTPTPAIENRDYSVYGQLSASIDVQLMPRLALDVGPSVDVVLAHSASLSGDTSTLNAGSALILALGHWDLYGNFDVNDLLAHRPSTFSSVGFVHRWGG
jgi:hypothetical protein